MSTVNPEEIEKFSRIASQWWDPNGKFKPLHIINPLRVAYIKEHVEKHFTDGMKNISIIDIGCGGGLVTEEMALLGAKVTGIDASEKNIAVAKLHARESGLDIDYRSTSAETITNEKFDVVLALEIIEHVADVEKFASEVMRLVKPGGLVFLSTINRTPKSFALAIVGAEYLLRWLPRGTHDWNKFIKPHELLGMVESHGGELMEMTGMTMNPLSFQWRLNPQDLSVNYLLIVKK